jgi:CHAT domain-containing protein
MPCPQITTSFNLSEVQKSVLVLAGEEQLTLAEISQHTFSNYNLCTLTNSENVSNNNQNINSEYVGFTTRLLSRGVPYVVSTIWTVESSASALVIIEFYRRLLFHQSPVTALAEVTTWLRDITVGELINWYEDLLTNLHSDDVKLRNYVMMQVDKIRELSPQQQPYNHPYYWAAFIITGRG